MEIQSCALDNKPGFRWNIATVPSANAARTRPCVCLKQKQQHRKIQ